MTEGAGHCHPEPAEGSARPDGVLDRIGREDKGKDYGKDEGVRSVVFTVIFALVYPGLLTSDLPYGSIILLRMA